MPAQLFSNNELVEVMRTVSAPGGFFTRHYFPTADKDIFTTPKVFVENDDDGNRAAPFVVPYSGARTMERESYTGVEVVPAYINPSRDMTMDTLRRKGIGETLYDTQATPESRETNYLADDLVYLLNAIARRVEWMCGRILTEGQVDCTVDGGEAAKFKYFDGTFGNMLTPTATWGADGADIYGTICSAALDIDEKYGDLDLVLGADTVRAFMSDDFILRLLDVRNAQVGGIAPDDHAEDGSGYIGSINFGGRQLDIYSYTGSVNIDGSLEHYIDPKKAVVVPRKGFGAVKYGAISQYEEEDRQLHTYTAAIVPRIVTDVSGNKRSLECASAPAPVPYAWDSWRVINAL